MMDCETENRSRRIFSTLILLLFIVSAYLAEAQSLNIKQTIDPYITGPHAKVVKDILSAPESVICYRLAEAEDNVDGVKRLDLYWIRTNISKELTDDEKKILFDNVLHNEVNYQKEMALLSSPYVPVVDFQLTRKGKCIDVLVSLNDRSWTIIYDGIRIFNNRYNNGFDFGEFINKLVPIDTSFSCK